MTIYIYQASCNFLPPDGLQFSSTGELYFVTQCQPSDMNVGAGSTRGFIAFSDDNGNNWQYPKTDEDDFSSGFDDAFDKFDAFKDFADFDDSNDFSGFDGTVDRNNSVDFALPPGLDVMPDSFSAFSSGGSYVSTMASSHDPVCGRRRAKSFHAGEEFELNRGNIHLDAEEAVKKLLNSQDPNASANFGFPGTAAATHPFFTPRSSFGGNSEKYPPALSPVFEDEYEHGHEGCQSTLFSQSIEEHDPFAEFEDFDDTLEHELSRLLPQISLKIHDESFKVIFKKRDKKVISNFLTEASLNFDIQSVGHKSAKKTSRDKSAKKTKWVFVILTRAQASQLVASLSETAQVDAGRKAPGVSC